MSTVSAFPQPAPAMAKSAAARAKAYRARKKASAQPGDRQTDTGRPAPPASPAKSPAGTTPSPGAVPRRFVTRWVLTIAALCLASAGVAINGWFARTLGSNDAAGLLFLTVGMASDLVALVLPSCAADLWRHGRWVRATVGWSLWIVSFAFAVTAGIGFASTNISDVTLVRASRVTPILTAAQAALADAVTARDRECKGGVGKYCREREADVAEQRRVVVTATQAIDQAADPQTRAAAGLVAWVSRGLLAPAPGDFVMFRLILLALLPQLGGLLIMVARPE